LGIADGRQLNSTKSLACLPFRNTPRNGALACIEMKMIGKPYVEELQGRLDEGEQAFIPWTILYGHESGNGGYSQEFA
jgi:hypothetical protein